MRAISVILTVVFLFVCAAHAASFQSKFKCSDSAKRCTAPGGHRTIDGMQVYRDCWEYSYVKECEVPSKNNCEPLIKEGCIFNTSPGSGTKCLEQDTSGACLNELREYTCLRDMEFEIEDEKIVVDPDDKNRAKRLYCAGLEHAQNYSANNNPNNELANSLAKLNMAMGMSDGVSGKDPNSLTVNIFGGKCLHCSKKFLDYSNCCNDSGWGRNFGAGCSADEQELMKQRKDNMCIEIGWECVARFLGQCTVKKYFFCCYKNKFEKAINRLRSPADLKARGCNGFSMDEIAKIDFSKVDLKEFEQDVLKRMESKTKDHVKNLKNRLESNMPQIKKTTKSDLKKGAANEGGSNSEVLRDNLKQNEESKFNPGREQKWKEKIAR